MNSTANLSTQGGWRISENRQHAGGPHSATRHSLSKVWRNYFRHPALFLWCMAVAGCRIWKLGGWWIRRWRVMNSHLAGVKFAAGAGWWIRMCRVAGGAYKRTMPNFVLLRCSFNLCIATGIHLRRDHRLFWRARDKHSTLIRTLRASCIDNKMWIVGNRLVDME